MLLVFVLIDLLCCVLLSVLFIACVFPTVRCVCVVVCLFCLSSALSLCGVCLMSWSVLFVCYCAAVAVCCLFIVLFDMVLSCVLCVVVFVVVVVVLCVLLVIRFVVRLVFVCLCVCLSLCASVVLFFVYVAVCLSCCGLFVCMFVVVVFVCFD